MLLAFSNVCILRVRMPISDDLSPRNFITKIVKYEKVRLASLVEQTVHKVFLYRQGASVFKQYGNSVMRSPRAVWHLFYVFRSCRVLYSLFDLPLTGGKYPQLNDRADGPFAGILDHGGAEIAGEQLCLKSYTPGNPIYRRRSSACYPLVS